VGHVPLVFCTIVDFGLCLAWKTSSLWKKETLVSKNKANNPIKLDHQNHHSEDKWTTK
jgi:hypothetical protein